MIIILFKSLGKRTSIGSYYDEKSLTKCYWDGVCGSFIFPGGLYQILFIVSQSDGVCTTNSVPNGPQRPGFYRLIAV